MAKTGWSAKDYTPFYLFDEPVHTPKEVRAEYTRMRDIMVKRANRLEKAGLSLQADYIRKMTPKIGTMKSDYEVKKHLAEMRTLHQTKAYSIAGIKQLQKIFQSEGADVPTEDVLGFSEYMQSWRLSAFSNTLVGSAEAAGMHDGVYQDYGGRFSDFYTLYKGITV